MAGNSAGETPGAPAQKPKAPLPKSRALVNEQTAGVYARAWEAHERGEPVGWSTAIFPQELCETFDVPVLYPENNAAAISARHMGEPFIQHAEGEMKYPINICSYARLNMGMADKMRKAESIQTQGGGARSPQGLTGPPEVTVQTQGGGARSPQGLTGPPETPDGYKRIDPAMAPPAFLCLANNSCTQLMKWYENLSRNLNIPVFFVDCLFNYSEEEPAPHKIAYVRGQIENCIRQMEEFFGKKFDRDRFLEVQRISQANRVLFNEIVALNARKPAPMNGFDLFNYMAPLVICRGKESTTVILTELKKETEAHIAAGTSTFRGEEKHRVHWEGIACWPNLGHNLKTLGGYGVNAVMNGYVTAWDVAYEPGDLDGMARAYQVSSTNSLTTPGIMKKRIASIDRFGCDGMLCHVNRSCKLMTFHIMVGREMIEEEAKVPVANFDGDQSDTRVFSEAQFETRLQGLVEIMSGNRNKNGNKEARHA